MPGTGFILPTSTMVVSTAGVGTWTLTSNLLANDGSEAELSLTGKNSTGMWCAGQNFGFNSLLTTAGISITSVKIQADWRVTNAAFAIANLDLQAWVSGNSTATLTSNVNEPTSLTTNTYDITSDRAWVTADLLDSTFELRVRGRNGNNAGDPSYRFDYIAVEVGYSEPAVAGAVSLNRILTAPLMPVGRWGRGN